MPIPVWSLDDFFDSYVELLIAGDVDALGQLYTEDAVVTSAGGPITNSWAVGRPAIVAGLKASLAEFRILSETPPHSPYQRQGDDLAARFGTFHATARSTLTGETIQMAVEATEVFRLSEVHGWRYLADHTRVVSVTTTE